MVDRVNNLPSMELEAKTQEWSKNTWVWYLNEGEAVGCIVTKKDGDSWTLRLPNANEIKVNKDDCDLMNPPKYDKCEDMANLTHLNELSVLMNLKERYLSNLIYTYSGLFLVVINPWRRLPLYTDEIVAMYKGKKRKEMAPHIFAVCDEAYRAMLENKENQSLLITGESGAGKTENTKKVIQYLASIAGTAGALGSSAESGQGVLEKQIVKTNPLLESFGNAKTIRNNNSSRFGKFIRIEFRGDGKIVGCNIDNYLLEKSRVVRHSQNERSFHIFYQIVAGSDDEMKKNYLLEGFRFYKYLSGITEIDGVNNAAEFKDTIEAMDIIGFNAEEKGSIWAIVSACLLFGNLNFSSGKRDDAASITDPSIADKISHLMGISSADFQKGLIKPRVKAGREWVTAMVTAEKAFASADALAKSTYERLFKWIVRKINQALVTQSDAQTFIGCLDIAGFEIFENNSFEQLCINLTNEKLQMFFNHHMFILEQEEYAKEGIEWKFIDFGFDLIPTIDLIEKPMGIMSILDEECLFPKATDKSFLEKLNATHAGKHDKYGTIKLHPDSFIIHHYAGQVEYDTKDWLEKNKDPINENIARSLSRSSNSLVAILFEEFVDMEIEGETNTATNFKRKGKAATFITVSQRHRQQLNNLMTTLHNTIPHFVRCIIPNEQKKPGIIEAPLVLDQLRCNGVLEGIRICRLGFPSKIPFAEFKQRYEILATGVIPKGFMDGRVACEKLIAALTIPPEQFRVGISKVFFKAGIIAELEERRDQKLGRLISGFQAICRGFFSRRAYRREHGQEEAIKTIQKNARIFIELYQWSWWKLYRQVKPLLSIHRQEQEERSLKEKIKQLEAALQEEAKKRAELETLKTQITAERDNLLNDLQAERDALEETVASLKRTEEARKELQTLTSELEQQLDEADKNANELEKTKKHLQVQVEELKTQLSDDSDKLKAVEEMKKLMEGELEVLKQQYAKEKEKLINDLDDERTKMDSQIASFKEQITSLTASLDRLKKQNKTIAAEKDDLVAALEETERAKNKSEKSLRKLEEDFAVAQTDLRDKTTRLATLEEQKKNAEVRMNEYKAKLEEAESARTTIDAIKKNLEAELEELTTQLETTSKAKSLAEKRTKTLEDELDEVSQKFEAEKKKREELEANQRGVEKELADVKEKLQKAVTDADNSLVEALKNERLKNKALEDKLAAESGKRVSVEERLTNESNKVRELERKIREIREILRQ